MLRFYYSSKYKYTNRYIIDVSSDTDYADIDYENIDSPDSINGHIIYTLGKNEKIPTYIVDTTNSKKWFVTGITQLRTSKYQISLLRDVISESPNTWRNERNAYIKAGTATNYNKYKVWGLPFTNTKVSQQRLSVNGKSSFFVFYNNTQHISGNGNITEDDLELNATNIPGVTVFDYTVNTLNEIPSYEYIGTPNLVSYDNEQNILVQVDIRSAGTNRIRYTLNGSNSEVAYQDNASLSGYLNIEGLNYQYFQNNINNSLTQTATAVENWKNSYLATLYPNSIPSASVSNLSSYVDKVIYVQSEGKAYRLRLTQQPQQFVYQLLNSTETGTLRSALSNITYPGATNPSFSVSGNGFVWFYFAGYKYSYTLEDLGVATSFNFTFKANVRKLPKSAVRCVNIVSDSTISDEDLGNALMSMQANAGNPNDDTGRIVDIQYLPFQVASTTNANIQINSQNMTALFLNSDDYLYTTSLSNLTNINKETDSIKIVSPSRASQYLFKPYNNDGNMTFTTKITIKPYSSVIYVRPSTTGLLMFDWDDKDCLTIAEDMSLTQISSEWANYVYSNRNYQNAFNRTIQGREFERSWEMRVEEANLLAEDWNSRNISAQKAQTYTANLPIISSIAGAIGTAWQDEGYMRAVQTDLEYNRAMHQEAISLARDQFNYQIDNIKSQPTMPSKITTIDCKLLDGIYLEFYSTNQTELNAIESYYKYNGNRIDDYGSFNDYWGGFVQGKLIQSINYNQPELNELNIRLNMGIFTENL